MELAHDLQSVPAVASADQSSTVMGKAKEQSKPNNMYDSN